MQTNEAYRVLVIDDNPDMHEYFRKILADDDGPARQSDQAEAEIPGPTAPGRLMPRFEVDFACQGEEGLAQVARAREAGRPYAIVFVDGRMPPGWDGIETIGHLWKEDPALEAVLCTAFSDYSLQDLTRRLRRTDQLLMLKKPFDPIEAQQLAVALSEKWRLARAAHSYFASLEAQLRQSQKMDSIGQLAGGIAHDFNNLLTVINGHASLLLAGEKLTPRGTDSLKEIIEAGKRAGTLTRQLMTFSRKQEFHPQAADLNEVISQIAKMLRRILGEDVALNVDFSPGLPSIMADLGMIEQVLLNLAVNSRDAMPRGGQLHITTSAVVVDSATAQQNPEASPGRFVCLTFRDTGCGIAPENLSRIFEPFFTTKEMDRGTGLGLATVYGIIKQHQGWIAVQSRLGEGTTFQIFLPVSTASGGALQMAPAEQKVIGGTETLLVVEDEAPLLKLMQHILESHGYQVLGCSNGRQALDLWGQQPNKIDLLLTDLILPDGMAGTELARILQKSKPGLKVLYTSGYNAERLAKEFPPGTHVNLVQKPFHARRLVEGVFETLSVSS